MTIAEPEKIPFVSKIHKFGRITAPPEPATALPTMRAADVGARAHIKEPTKCISEDSKIEPTFKDRYC